jgi:hypothetical protein
MRIVLWALQGLVMTTVAGCAVRIITPNDGAAVRGVTAPVAVPVEIEVTGNVFNRRFVITGGPPGQDPVVLTDLASRPATGPFGGVILSGSALLPFATNYVLTARGEATGILSGTIPWQLVDVHHFSVVSAPAPTLALAVAPDPVLVPRKGSATVGYTVTRTGSTDAVTVKASGLPTGVTLAPATTSITNFTGNQGSAGATASASAIATGTAQAQFTATLSGAADSTVGRTIKVVPEPGLFSWGKPPSIEGLVPATPSSPDGRFTTSVARTGPGFSRDWTFTITPTGGSGTPLTVTAASWPLRSSIMGIVFCPATPTTSALVLSDTDESEDPSTHSPDAIYRYKIIDLRGPSPRLAGNLEELRYETAVLPWHAFSPDCSMVGSWTTDSAYTARSIAFANAFTGQVFASLPVGTTIADPTPDFTATIAGQTLTVRGPTLPSGGRSFTIP